MKRLLLLLLITIVTASCGENTSTNDVSAINDSDLALTADTIPSYIDTMIINEAVLWSSDSLFVAKQLVYDTILSGVDNNIPEPRYKVSIYRQEQPIHTVTPDEEYFYVVERWLSDYDILIGEASPYSLDGYKIYNANQQQLYTVEYNTGYELSQLEVPEGQEIVFQIEGTTINGYKVVAVKNFEERYGIGLVHVLTYEDTTIAFFSDTTSAPLHTYTPGELANLKNIAISTDGTTDVFSPYQLYAEYDIFQLICVSTYGEWAKIIVNSQSGASLWVRNTGAIRYQSWEQHLVDGVADMDRLSPSNNPLRNGPGQEHEAVPYQGFDSFDIIEVDGDWIKVENGGCGDGYDPGFDGGWIKWRDNRKFLVELYMIC